MTISAQQQAIDLIEENVTAWTNTLVTWLQEDVKQNEIKSARRNLLEALQNHGSILTTPLNLKRFRMVQ